MQIAQPVESLQRERQAGQQPDDEQAALVVMADMPQSITILSIVEAFIFNVTSILVHVVQAATADATRREVGEPVGIDDIAIRFVLAIAEHTHRFPLQAFPRIEVIGVPDLHAIGIVPEYQGRRSGTEALLRRAEEFGQILLQPSHYRPAGLSRSRGERGRGEFTVTDHRAGEAWSPALAHGTHQPTAGP